MTAWNWRAEELTPETWRVKLSSDELMALDSAVQDVRDIDLAEMSAASFEVGPLKTRIEQLDAALSEGPGFQAWEGVPVSNYTSDELRKLYWGLSLHLGTPVAQSYRGDVIGDVRDLGTGISGKKGRGYTSNQPLNFHSDAADVTGLFYLKNARTGGVNGIASSNAVHDEIGRRRPDLLEVLYQPLCWSWQGNQLEGEPAYYRMPVFGQSEGGLACAYVRTNILRAHANAGAPRMTNQQIEAVEYFASVAAEPEFALTTMFQPGTLVFFNNHRVLHMRTAFEDWSDPERRRHLLRIWLSLRSSQELPQSFSAFFGDTGAGQLRGGYVSRTPRPVFETVDDEAAAD